MPYLNFKTSTKLSDEQKRDVVDILMENTTTVLGKKAEVTSISIENIDNKDWFINSSSLENRNEQTFYLNIKITEGTNTKNQKALYIKNIFEQLTSIFENISEASYIIIDDIGADSWGFSGKTQEYRYINSINL